MKRFVLIKDFPFHKIGDILVINEDGDKWWETDLTPLNNLYYDATFFKPAHEFKYNIGDTCFYVRNKCEKVAFEYEIVSSKLTHDKLGDFYELKCLNRTETNITTREENIVKFLRYWFVNSSGVNCKSYYFPNYENFNKQFKNYSKNLTTYSKLQGSYEYRKKVGNVFYRHRDLEIFRENLAKSQIK